MPGLEGGGDTFFGMVDDDEIALRGLEFATEHLANPAEAANDHMIGKLVDVLLHAAAPENLLELAGGDQLEQAAGEKDHPRAARNDQRDRNGAQNRRIDRDDLAIADRIDRKNNHIDGVIQIPSRGHVGQRGRDGDDQHESQASDQISQRGGEKLNHRNSNSAPKQLTR